LNLAQTYQLMGQHAVIDSILALFASRKIPFPIGNFRYAEFWARRQYDSAEQVARIAVDSATPTRAAGAMTGMVWTTAILGGLHDAEHWYGKSIEARARARGDTVSTYDAADFHAKLDGLVRGDSARGVADLDAAMRATPLASVPVATDGSAKLALDYALLGNAAKARELLNQHESRLDSLTRRRQFVIDGRTRGAIALAEGKPDSAIAWFRRSDNEADGLPTSNCMICTPYLLGIAFDRGGRADSARKYLTQFVDMNGTGRIQNDPFLVAPTLFRLGELYQAAGDSKHAIDYYSRFVDLWARADPDLQPRVAAARAHIAELTRAKG
jgi:tetratricopeptide (TPR) repeat protein